MDVPSFTDGAASALPPDMRPLAQLFYPEIDWSVAGVFTAGEGPVSDELAARVASAYPIASAQFSGYGASTWAAIDSKKQDVQAALTHLHDLRQLVTILSDPGATELFWGMDETFPERTAHYRTNPTDQRDLICDHLLRLAEAVGALPIWLPESVGPRTVAADVDETITAIERGTGISLKFPNPYPREFGIATTHGVVADRALQAIFQAWRIRDFAKRHGGKILEIGAGLGRTAYYAREFGIKDYTIVDLPMGLVVQAAFLGRVLDKGALAFPGEAGGSDLIKIVMPTKLLTGNERFDIVLNVDSMTEMDRAYAEAYAAFIASHAKVFISINHEANFRVNELEPLRSAAVIRTPYWMRPGYVEEFFFFPGAERGAPKPMDGRDHLARFLVGTAARWHAMLQGTRRNAE
jgi:hypothetical protein